MTRTCDTCKFYAHGKCYQSPTIAKRRPDDLACVSWTSCRTAPDIPTRLRGGWSDRPAKGTA
jgi:hypothetical protein